MFDPYLISSNTSLYSCVAWRVTSPVAVSLSRVRYPFVRRSTFSSGQTLVWTQMTPRCSGMTKGILNHSRVGKLVIGPQSVSPPVTQTLQTARLWLRVSVSATLNTTIRNNLRVNFSSIHSHPSNQMDTPFSGLSFSQNFQGTRVPLRGFQNFIC